MKTQAEYKADQREKKRKLGLRPYEIWIPPSAWPTVKRFIKRIVDQFIKRR